jgi:hypothetical protein
MHTVGCTQRACVVKYATPTHTHARTHACANRQAHASKQRTGRQTAFLLRQMIAPLGCMWLGLWPQPASRCSAGQVDWCQHSTPAPAARSFLRLRLARQQRRPVQAAAGECAPSLAGRASLRLRCSRVRLVCGLGDLQTPATRTSIARDADLRMRAPEAWKEWVREKGNIWQPTAIDPRATRALHSHFQSFALAACALRVLQGVPTSVTAAVCGGAMSTGWRVHRMPLTGVAGETGRRPPKAGKHGRTCTTPLQGSRTAEEVIFQLRIVA